MDGFAATLPQPPPVGDQGPLVSVVVPVRNEAGNVGPLALELATALGATPHELIFVDDGSSDGTSEVLRALSVGSGSIRLARHRRPCGQSAAVVTGARLARAPWLATIDGDGQNDPADLPGLLRRAREAGGDVMVAGHRTRRRDGWVKRASSKVANGVRARLLGDATPDTGCGLKVLPTALFLALPRFDHMHRFLPALVLRAGGGVVSVPVNHRPRLRGTSNYGTFDRLAVGVVDLAGVWWLQRRWRVPEVEP